MTFVQWLKRMGAKRILFALLLSVVVSVNIYRAALTLSDSDWLATLCALIVCFFAGRAIGWYWLKKDGVL
jgi:TRAP-type C4-dicarboxylate transport system permease large subunit